MCLDKVDYGYDGMLLTVFVDKLDRCPRIKF